MKAASVQTVRYRDICALDSEVKFTYYIVCLIRQT